jgi:hypothetical protein
MMGVPCESGMMSAIVLNKRNLGISGPVLGSSWCNFTVDSSKEQSSWCEEDILNTTMPKVSQNAVMENHGYKTRE